MMRRAAGMRWPAGSVQGSSAAPARRAWRAGDRAAAGRILRGRFPLSPVRQFTQDHSHMAVSSPPGVTISSSVSHT